jgi:hypothetical protein
MTSATIDGIAAIANSHILIADPHYVIGGSASSSTWHSAAT